MSARVKLLQASITGLPEGLGERAGLAESAFSELGIGSRRSRPRRGSSRHRSRYEVVSTTQAEGIEDRMTMTPLAARRLGEMVELGTRIVAIELLLAAQACDLRGAELGAGTARAHAAVRRVAPFLREGEPLPDVEAARSSSSASGSLLLRMTATYDIHQHLWPPAFLDALRARTEPPYLRDDVLVDGRGARSSSTRRPRSRASGRRSSTATASTSPCSRSSRRLGIEGLPGLSATSSRRPGSKASAELVAASDGRFRALAPWRIVDGFAGTSVGASALVDRRARASLLEAVDAGGGLALRASRGRAPGDAPNRPEWWSGRPATRRRCSSAYLAWLGGGRDPIPPLRIVFAILAGGAPIHHERLAHRGVDVRSALDPNTLFDTSTYGRRAIELCIETFGVERLVYGSDTPVVDPRPTLAAVRGLGDSVARLLQSDTPGRLIA